MENLKNAIRLEDEKELQKVVQDIKDTDFSKNHYQVIYSYLTDYRIKQLKKGEIELSKAVEIAIKKATQKWNKSLENQLEKIDNIADSKEFEDITITIEWKKSKTWGSNPTASISGGAYIQGSSISGCGYDKESTAVAQVLNQYYPFLKLMYQKKNDNIDKSNHAIFGYGSGYGILPYFEGGVGVSCLRSICDSIGLTFKCLSSGKTFDVYSISKEDK